jgi:dihydrofolate reductase
MKGGTTFYFVTDGIESAMKQAREAAGAKDVAIAGGANVINQYLAAGLIDELWLHIAPVTVGSGQRLFKDTPDIKLKPLEARTTDVVTHIKYAIQHD